MRRAAALALLAVTVAGCQVGPLGGPQRAIPNETGVGPRATFVVATLAGLLGLDAQGRPLGRIVDLPPGAVPSGSALHPDGKTIFFALSQTRERVGFGSEIYSVEIDGSALRPVVTRDQPNVFYASPSFGAAGDLYVHRRAAKDDPGHPGVYLEVTDAIERIDLRTGERRRILDDGAEPAAGSAGRMVFVRLDRGQPVGLWTASTDGSSAEPLLKTGDRFWYLQAPRISPNGRELAWSSAGRSDPSSAIPGTLAHTSAGGKLAHLDIPSELYVAPLDGTSLRSIAVTRDDVVPAWSPDGARIAYIALATFYIVSARDGEVILHTEGIGFSYGDLIWVR